MALHDHRDNLKCVSQIVSLNISFFLSVCVLDWGTNMFLSSSPNLLSVVSITVQPISFSGAQRKCVRNVCQGWNWPLPPWNYLEVSLHWADILWQDGNVPFIPSQSLASNDALKIFYPNSASACYLFTVVIVCINGNNITMCTDRKPFKLTITL